jgi:N-acyl-D-amino-acid deacylase
MAEVDVVIRGGKVVDGTSNPWFYGDVALFGDRVAAVKPPGQIPANGTAEIDAAGMVVCPGFIDIQSHSIVPLMIDGRCLSKITQGVTTEIMGEAWTPAPFGGRITEPIGAIIRGSTADLLRDWEPRVRGWSRFRDWLEAMIERGVSPNIGSFLGGGTLRSYVKGTEMGPATVEELAAMRRLMAEAMEDGAFGVSYALIYVPDTFANTDELIDMCKVVAGYGGIYITHIRSEGQHLLEAMDEAIEIGQKANLPVELYHLKASGRDNWHKMPAAIERINQARASGLDVTADMYPYAGSGTGLSSVFPPWAAAEGKFYENLRDPKMRARIREEVLHPSGDWEALATDGPESVMPLGFDKPENREYRGKRLSEIAAMRGQDWIDAAMDLLVTEGQRIGTVYFSMTEDNLEMQIREPWIKISTDAGGVDPAWARELGPTHPRGYGTYPRVLAKYVREQGVISLEDAIRKMTSAVADRIGLRDRGLLRAGCFADVVIFDPEAVEDRATFDEPHQLSVGVRDVWVNGVRVLEDGIHTGATPGVVASRQSAT